jgi:uncharacterized protein YkwD
MPRIPEPDDEIEPAAVARFYDLSNRVLGSGSQRARLEDAVARMVNDYRAKSGLRPLATNERLRDSARQHSEDMARGGFFSHDSPDGYTAFDRMLLAGYEHPGAENIAKGQEQPESAMRAWLNSPGHRANIMNAKFRAIGVGVRLGPGGPWWTQHFGY